MTLTCELHGVVMDPEHVPPAWCVPHCITTCTSAHVSSRSHATRVERNISYLEANKQKIQITDKFLDGIFLGIKESSESSSLELLLVVWCAELSSDGLVKTL